MKTICHCLPLSALPGTGWSTVASLRFFSLYTLNLHHLQKEGRIHQFRMCNILSMCCLFCTSLTMLRRCTALWGSCVFDADGRPASAAFKDVEYFIDWNRHSFPLCFFFFRRTFWVLQIGSTADDGRKMWGGATDASRVRVRETWFGNTLEMNFFAVGQKGPSYISYFARFVKAMCLEDTAVGLKGIWTVIRSGCAHGALCRLNGERGR